MPVPLPISEAFEIYRRDFIVYNNQSKKTEEMHLLAMRALISFVGDIDIQTLTFQQIRDWKEHMERTRGQNTVRGYILKLRVVIAYLPKRGYEVLDSDVIGVPKRKQTVVEFIPENDVRRLIEAAYEPRAGYDTVNRYRNRAVISLLYASGIRVSELVKMNISDIQKDGTFTVIGKGDRPRLCFIDERTIDYINAYLELRDDNEVALFLSEQTGKRMTAGVVQLMFRHVRKYAGFKQPIHPHTLRHSYATNLLRNNTNLIYVRDFLGHTSVQTTEMYTHVVNEDLRRIYKEKHTI